MPKFLSKILAHQLSHPEGFLGGIILKLLNKKNSIIINETLNLIPLEENTQFLDIGFGGGLPFELIAAANKSVKMHGLELSEKAVADANKKFKQEIEAGRLIIKQGVVEAIPFEDQSFDSIISINTVYFWDDVEAALREIKRVLNPGGTFILSLREKDTLSKYKPTEFVFHHYPTGDLIEAFESAGFHVAIHQKKDDLPFICMQATS